MKLDVAYLPVRRNHNPVVTGRIEILFPDGQAIAGILVCLLSYFPCFLKFSSDPNPLGCLELAT
jgi:hypothetical protein